MLPENAFVTGDLFFNLFSYASQSDVSSLGLSVHLDIVSSSRLQCRIVGC
jgi:hypothetical protein